MSHRPLRRGNWAVQELERLRQLLPRRGVEHTATLLRRSPASVLRKAMALLRVPARRGDWTASDDARLRDSWGAVDARLLGPMLGRPPIEVRRRAAGLRERLRSGPWSHAEVLLLKELYGTRNDHDLEVCLLRTKADITAMARRTCLAKDKRFAAQMPGGVLGDAAPIVRSLMPRWTAQQVEQLVACYCDRDNLAVARELGRTVNSVANKANQLGLKKSVRLLTDIGRNNVAMRYGRSDEGPAQEASG